MQTGRNSRLINVLRSGKPLSLVLCCFLFLIGSCWIAFGRSNVHAQGQVGSYTVVAGDSLSAIAGRFGVTVDELVMLNNIADPALIEVGQVLLIPSRSGADTLEAVTTVQATALPGETLRGLARRLQQDPAVLSALNSISDTGRLFPMQPIRLPANGQSGVPSPLRFGAIDAVGLPGTLIQGRTGRLLVQSSRPLSITAAWNGLPIAFTPVATTDTAQLTTNAHSSFALLPVPALIAPGSYNVDLSYTARQRLSLAAQLAGQCSGRTIR